MNLESQLQQRLLLSAPSRLPDIRFFRRNVGKVKVTRKDGKEYTMRFALPGQCDLYGITRGGRHLECELKGPGKKLEPDQVKWRDWCLEWRIPHIVLTAQKNELETQTVERWLDELGALLAHKS